MQNYIYRNSYRNAAKKRIWLLPFYILGAIGVVYAAYDKENVWLLLFPGLIAYWGIYVGVGYIKGLKNEGEWVFELNDSYFIYTDPFSEHYQLALSDIKHVLYIDLGGETGSLEVAITLHSGKVFVLKEDVSGVDFSLLCRAFESRGVHVSREYR